VIDAIAGSQSVRIAQRVADGVVRIGAIHTCVELDAVKTRERNRTLRAGLNRIETERKLVALNQILGRTAGRPLRWGVAVSCRAP
jgi:hypothetical protein